MKPRRDREPPRPPSQDWLLAVLSVAGLLVAAYLAWTKLAGGTALFCTAGSGCDVVQASRYATFLGLPTGAWGAALYAGIAGLALAGLSPRRWFAAFLLAVVGLSFSVYLTYLELFVIGAVCAYCVISAAIMAGVFAVVLWRRPAPRGRRSPTRTPRVAAWGSLTALATVALGVVVFETGTLGEASEYQVALARHLTDSGAMMYGAFW